MIAERNGACNHPTQARQARLADPDRFLTVSRRALLLVSLLGVTCPASYLEEQRVFELGNRQRRKRRLRELLWRDDIKDEARRHSLRMMELGFFSHHDPARGALAQRLSAAGLSFRGAAENLNYSRGYSDPPAAAVQGWMMSPGHRKNLLDSAFTHTGIGVARAKDGTWYATQIFLRPA
jgi:uncharacterized protein YkwD